MTTIGELVEAAGGLLHKRHLVRHGATDAHLTLAVRSGEVRRPRRGWYSTFPPDDPRFVAVRVGGRLTGASALRRLGAWMWAEPRVTVSVHDNASRLRWKKGVRVVWDDRGVRDRGGLWSVGLHDALRQAVLELPFEEAVAVLDWALKTDRLSMDDIPGLLAPLPADTQEIADWVSPLCDSFPESIARTRIRLDGHEVRCQLPLPNGQRVDIEVDGVLGVEVDGRETHAGEFEADRRKDLRIQTVRRTPLRLSYTMVRDEWPAIRVAVDTAVAVHSGRPRVLGNSGPVPTPARVGPRLWRIRPRGRGTSPELPRRRGRRGTARRRCPMLATILG